VESGDVEIRPLAALDPTRKLFSVSVEDGVGEDLEEDSVEIAYATIVTALAGESVGVAQRTLEMAVEYAKDRKQFDRPIGAYQAVSHRCAQMMLETEGARSITYWAAWALDHEPETAPRAAAMAKAYAGDAGFRVPAAALQVHGGIGFTWEHDLHFFLKRGKANAQVFGDSRWHRERAIALGS
jgi:alkylation response protein AidB-like acyl-CoA dehydrogenase